jgi:hypothetical protein
MWRMVVLVLIACSGCAPREQPSTLAAIEVPIPTGRDRTDLIKALEEFGAAEALHVDVATAQALEYERSNLPQDAHSTLRMGVWRGDKDQDLEMSVTDMGHLGRAWVSFIRSGDADVSGEGRERLLGVLRDRWPDARLLPVLPSGGLPLARDLVATPQGYEVIRSERGKYDLPVEPPAVH